jgi:hypothetical protein
MNGNVIAYTANTAVNVYGIYGEPIPAADGPVINGNRIVVVNTGAGTGEAFNVNQTNGTSVGNTYAGSDAKGTLNLGQVGFNDP